MVDEVLEYVGGFGFIKNEPSGFLLGAMSTSFLSVTDQHLWVRG